MENRSPSSQLKKKPKSEKHLVFKNSKSMPYSASKRSKRSLQRSIKSLKKCDDENNVNGIRIEEDNNKMNKIPTSEIITPVTGLNSKIQFVSPDYETNNIQAIPDSENQSFPKIATSYKNSGPINKIMQIDEDKNEISNEKNPLSLLRNQDFEIKCEENIIFPIENVPEFRYTQTDECLNFDNSKAFPDESNHFNPFWGDFLNGNIVEEDTFYPALNCAGANQNDMTDNKDPNTIQEIKNFIRKEFFDSDINEFDIYQSSKLPADNLQISKLNEVSSKRIQPMFKSNKSEENCDMGKKEQRDDVSAIPSSHEILQTLSNSNSPYIDSNKTLGQSGIYTQQSKNLNAETSSEVEKSEEDDNKTSLPRIMLSKEGSRLSSECNISGSNRFSSCDESAAFANFVACQLRFLPLGNALLCQNAIIQIIIDERRKLLENQMASAVFDQEK